MGIAATAAVNNTWVKATDQTASQTVAKDSILAPKAKALPQTGEHKQGIFLTILGFLTAALGLIILGNRRKKGSC